MIIKSSEILDLFLESDSLEKVNNWAKGSTNKNEDVFCEDILIGVVEKTSDKWQLKQIACNDPSHGTHRRYKKYFKKLAKLGFKAENKPAKDCSKCNGSGLIPVNTQEGRQLIMLAQGMMIFRGIVLSYNGYKQQPINIEKLRGTIEEFVSNIATKERAGKQ